MIPRSPATPAPCAVALLLLLSSAPAAFAAGDSEETLREQAIAAAAASGQLPGERAFRELAPLAPPPGDYRLFVGVDDAALYTYRIDVGHGAAIPQFDGYQAWGAAYDVVNHRIYFNQGGSLYSWDVGAVGVGGPVAMTYEAAALSAVGLAYHDGHLYASKNNPNEAIYRVDTTTGVATIWSDYTDASYDFGGLAFDPRTGFLYGTSDTAPRGIYRIFENGTTSLVAAYPDGVSDVDGLAIGEGRAYLVIDEPGSIHVYDLDADDWLAPLTSPWSTSEVFAAGAFIDALLYGSSFEPYPPDWTASSPSCSGKCGLFSSPCACDSACSAFNDCCLDVCRLCGKCP